MKKELVLLLIAVTCWGCVSGSRTAQLPQAIEQTTSTQEPAAVPEQYQVRLDSVLALFARGDDQAFENAMALLRRDVRALAEKYPGLAEDYEYSRLLASLNGIDSVLAATELSHRYLNEVDSLALANEAWPETDRTGLEPVVLSADSVFPMMSNGRIDFWIRYYTGPGKERFARTLYRMALYRPTIAAILEELELPGDLICVAAIESGFNLKARSRARAVGPWQFIAGTARLYGLRVDWWHDERRDLVASTYAAGNYLKDLYSIWEDWPLALAAYNCGEYRVARAVVSQKTTNFWELRLPKQTQRYVPKFLAALYITRDPEKYGFTIPVVEPFAFDEVRVEDATDVDVIAKAAEVDAEVVRDLNPSLLRWCTPPKEELAVKVPKGTGEKCTRNLAAIPQSERVTWRRHRVRRGETLFAIAQNYGTTVSTLKRLNNIKNPHRIREGQSLIVPIQGGTTELASTKPQYKTARRNPTKEDLEKYAARYAAPANHKKVYYLVKDGDTLGQIAEDYNTSARKLRAWNNLSYRSHIYPGQQLAVYVPVSHDVSMAPSHKSHKPNEEEYLRKEYVVKRGDTFHSISRKFNVKVVDLMVWNNKSSRSVIYPGDVLEIWLKK